MDIEPQARYDALVIGGSYAGLAAALQLARARQKLLVIDAGVRRNRFVSTSHGFLGQDGRDPSQIVADARAQLLAYPNAQWLAAQVRKAHANAGEFVATVEDGSMVRARKIVLATGVIDELPPVEGLAERWGRSVFHCPYCHGYELNQGSIGVIATGPNSLHQALMLPDWGQVTFLLNGKFEPDAEQSAELAKRGVSVERTKIARLTDAATIEFVDGRRLDFAGLFTASQIRMASPLAEQLGCAFEEGPMGAFIRTDAMKETSVPGVFACGDAARAAGSVALAVGDGTQAGVAAHRALLFG
ncbi:MULTISPECIES: NAD(P)/FAD-dependent oxidoreductase [Hydrocarboniphaga]|jgi:thioredoxin reductase|uniref:Putative oxidoreductase n=1 Tax=Hydrocarboniphaga effusa AP103 TaxID=1172194 RepID=I8TC38_9GAMM|nr:MULTISPECIES: NAD(P)/FAD-dependent oxidoreductase [Hydrocarboniphaga]EIT71450.1 putative oxidoreductase [Hydrocarboniphaga effusa AP103]MDZ4079320.1 NAD(P)/FAD-dependent oxidoreductase [Hydrocarboniphaga sp.]